MHLDTTPKCPADENWINASKDVHQWSLIQIYWICTFIHVSGSLFHPGQSNMVPSLVIWKKKKMLESGRCASKTCKDCGDWRDWCHKIPQIAFVLPPPPLWWWWSGGGGGSTTTAINIRCDAICAVLLQNRLSRDLRIFGVNFFSWKWRQKWQIWGMEVHCINRVENLNSGDYFAFWFCRKICGKQSE